MITVGEVTFLEGMSLISDGWFAAFGICLIAADILFRRSARKRRRRRFMQIVKRTVEDEMTALAGAGVASVRIEWWHFRSDPSEALVTSTAIDAVSQSFRVRDTSRVVVDILESLAVVVVTNRFRLLQAQRKKRADTRWGRAATSPATTPKLEPWWDILGVASTASRRDIDKAWRQLSKLHHPDRPGGSADAMRRITEARDEGRLRAA